MDAYLVAVEGLDVLSDYKKIPARILTAARQAVNKTTDRAKAEAAREMAAQVAFPARYLSGEDGRLRVSKRASNTDLTGIIVGRHRATSLARFAVGGTPGASPVKVQVKPGSVRPIPRSFLIRLRSGSAALDTKSNLGLAIRTKNGQKPNKAWKPLQIAPNLWLLYGPSVDQVFKSVANDVAPGAADFLEREFNRLLELQDSK